MFKPKFTITHNILNGISKITEIKAIVERSRVLPLNEAQLRRQAIIRMAHTSTSIEGNPLAEYQVDKVLSGMSISADQKSIIEVKNYQEGIKQVEKFSKVKKNITIELVLLLHATVMRKLLDIKKTGYFRPASIYIIDELGDGREKLRFEGPDARKVPFLINELLKWLSSKEARGLHPVIKASIFHSQFVHIHPFSDGNGRITRLLSQLILYQNGWDFRKILVLEDYYNKNRQAYYNALSQGWPEKYIEGADFTPWLEYFVNGFLFEAQQVEDKIQSIGFAKASKEEKQIFLDNDEVKIMDFLAVSGRLTSDDVVDVLKIAKRTAQLKLKNLVDKGLLSPQGRGPSTYYVLSS